MMSERDATIRIRELDWIMLAVTALCCLGLVLSVSSQSAQEPAFDGLKGQGARVALGIVALVAMAVLPIQRLRELSVRIWLVGLFALLVALVLGPEINYARRWIRFGGFSVQPVDWAKLALVVATAHLVAFCIEKKAGGLLQLALVLGPATLTAFVLFLQPDKGNAILALAVAGAMALAAGIGLRYLVFAGGAAGYAIQHVLRSDGYSDGRLQKWWTGDHPDQIAAARSAFELGGPTGVGVGAGWRQQGYVPEIQNDMIFAVVGEELGFLGSSLVVGAFTLIAIGGCRLALRLSDPFHRYIVFGCTVTVCSQGLLNMLVTTGAAPAKGIDLPFVSSGGTNLTASLGAIGLIGNAARSDRRATDNRSEVSGSRSGGRGRGKESDKKTRGQKRRLLSFG